MICEAILASTGLSRLNTEELLCCECRTKKKKILTWNGMYVCLPLTSPTVKPVYPAIAP